MEFSTPRQLLKAYRQGFSGSICDPHDVSNLLGELPMPVFGAAAHGLKNTGGRQLSLPFKSLLKFDSGFGSEQQTTGDCVSHSTRNAVDITRSVEIDIKGDREGFVARGATEGIYQSRGHRAQGMSCSKAARYVHQNGGILLRKEYDDIDLSIYNSAIGARHRLPSSVYVDEAQKHQVKTISLISTVEEARDALANGYAISVPIAEQTSGESVYDICAGYDSLSRYNVDGCDFFETHLAFSKAVERARSGKGPSVIVSNVVRLLPHSSSDDQRKYRDEKDLEADRKRDPLILFRKKCVEEGIAKDSEFEKILKEAKSQVDEETLWAEEQENPLAEDWEKNLFSENVNHDGLDYEANEPNGDKIVLVDAINHALDEELLYNDKSVIFGQDVGGGKGGVFTATRGLTDTHTKDRVFNSPLAEASIVGTAIGMATLGWKPIVEIQFGDYIWTAMMQIRNEMATMRYRSNGNWSCPFVIRVPVGGYIHGSLCHSQSIDGYFTHLPGIYIAYPSNAADAKGLLKMACRMDDPVIFMEHKSLYRQSYASSAEPDDEYLIPFGKSKIIQKGSELTIITWGAMVQSSIDAVNDLSLSEDVVEIIDLRTLNPLDFSSIKSSIKKTGKALIVYEDNLTNGPGAEISSLISDHCFEMLDGPIRRVASKDSPVPYNMYLEQDVLPQVEDIKETLKELLEY